MAPWDLFIPAKLYFPAMPEPIEVRLTCREMGYLDRQTERALLPEQRVVYRHPNHPAICVVLGKDIGSAPGR